MTLNEDRVKGIIFDIQRFSTHDGPGIRTTVFLKGCSLNCFWCHNPESINSNPELLFWRKLCISCLECVKRCPCNAFDEVAGEPVLDRTICKSCGKCAEYCPCGALKLAGKWIESDTLVNEIVRDRAFFNRSGGGVTFSGGEALLQSEFVLSTLKLCKATDIHTAIDTCGEVPWENIAKTLDFTDLYLYDIKPNSSELVKENFRRLVETGASVQVRIATIPGENDTAEAMHGLLDMVRGHSVNLLPYHKLGVGKYAALGRKCIAEKLEEPSQQTLLQLAGVLQTAGCNVEMNSLSSEEINKRG